MRPLLYGYLRLPTRSAAVGPFWNQVESFADRTGHTFAGVLSDVHSDCGFHALTRLVALDSSAAVAVPRLSHLQEVVGLACADAYDVEIMLQSRVFLLDRACPVAVGTFAPAAWSLS
ncbi:MAG: hypothetical protein QG608_673 [Actinomycetota bacterium]|nr:hypothetical protein [Actinomycetota bacterium]